MIGVKLKDYTVMKENAVYAKDRRYYLVTAVAKTSAISIISQDASERNIDIGASIMSLIKPSGGLKIQTSNEGLITYQGEKNLAFGIELGELKYKHKEDKFQLNPVSQAFHVKAKGAKPRQIKGPALVVSPEDPFVEID
jgi:hypothetical protein